MKKSNIIMYTTEDGLTKIETTFDNDTVWLSLDGMARLFQRDSSVIGKHVRNILRMENCQRIQFRQNLPTLPQTVKPTT